MPKVGGRPPGGRDPQSSQLTYLFPVSLNSESGGNNTERLRSKLVNGKIELVPEEPNTSPRLAPPTPVRNKHWVRREFNVNNINTYPESMFRAGHESRRESQDSRLTTPSQMSTTLRHRSFSPHKVVPPISPADQAERALVIRLKHACQGFRNLPVDPLYYNREEELTLKRLVKQEFNDFTLERMQNVYLELTGYDAKLTDYVTFSDLTLALVHNQVLPNKDILRLVAAQFIGQGDTKDKINYVELLQYVRGAVIEVSKQPPMRTTERLPGSPGVYVSERNGMHRNPITSQVEDYSAHSNKYPFGDRDKAKLQQTVRAELEDAEDSGMWEMEKIWQEFREADRENRTTMSREQIYKLTSICRIPLQMSLIDKIIDTACPQLSGQYKWDEYLEFIEKVLPTKTGLTLSKSKKPSEYVKELPQPSSNWPHPGSNKFDSGDPFSMPESFTTPRKPKADYSQNYTQSYSNRGASKQSNYDYDRHAAHSDHMRGTQPDESWFKRFERVTKMLYAYDQTNNGTLPYNMAEEKLHLGNDVHNLGLSDAEIRNALNRSKDSSNSVMIEILAEQLMMYDRYK